MRCALYLLTLRFVLLVQVKSNENLKKLGSGHICGSSDVADKQELQLPNKASLYTKKAEDSDLNPNSRILTLHFIILMLYIHFHICFFAHSLGYSLLFPINNNNVFIYMYV